MTALSEAVGLFYSILATLIGIGLVCGVVGLIYVLIFNRNK